MARKAYLTAYTGLLALAIILAVATWHSSDPLNDPDSCEYIFGGVSIFSGRGFLDMSRQPQTVFPPGYPILIGLVAILGINPVIAGKLVSVAASILTIIPLLPLAIRLFGRPAGIAVSLVYTVLPQRLVISNPPMSESLYLLLVVTATWLWVCETDEFHWPRAVAIGALLGYAYLVRPEGLICALLLFVFSHPVWKWWKTPDRLSIYISASVLILFMILYIFYLRAHTGKWTLSAKGYNLQLGIARSYGIPWSTLYRLNKDATKLDFSFLKESKGNFIKRYIHNIQLELGSLKYILDIYLFSCLLLGIALEYYRGNTVILKSMPVFIALGASLVYLPMFYIENRYVYIGSIPPLMMACWLMTTRFRPHWFGRPGSLIAQGTGWLPLAIILIFFLRVDASMARIKTDEPSVFQQIAWWLRDKVPS